jgi:hypothetical protein
MDLETTGGKSAATFTWRAADNTKAGIGKDDPLNPEAVTEIINGRHVSI